VAARARRVGCDRLALDAGFGTPATLVTATSHSGGRVGGRVGGAECGVGVGL
jgi:hypothetical protein